MILANGSSQYEIVERVAETSVYRVYICKDVHTGRPCLLQIAKMIEYNGGLERAAYVLRMLLHLADHYQKMHEVKHPGKRLGYELLFPQVVDSFVSSDQRGRRVNILEIAGVDELNKLVPLSSLAIRDRVRIDLPSSPWIMGRLLKLLGLAHSSGVSVNVVTGDNILLQPDEHRVIVFDWSSARIFQEPTPTKFAREDIVQAASAVVDALNGRHGDLDIPDVDEASQPYADYLRELATGRISDTHAAHRRFYEIVDARWERKFRPLTTIPLI